MRLNVGLDQSNSSRDEEKWSASLQYERGLIGFASGLNVWYKNKCGVTMILGFGSILKYRVRIIWDKVDSEKRQVLWGPRLSKFSFGHVKFETFSKQMEIWIDWFRVQEAIWTKEIHMVVVSLNMVFKAMSLANITIRWYRGSVEVWLSPWDLQEKESKDVNFFIYTYFNAINFWHGVLVCSVSLSNYIMNIFPF